MRTPRRPSRLDSTSLALTLLIASLVLAAGCKTGAEQSGASATEEPSKTASDEAQPEPSDDPSQDEAAPDELDAAPATSSTTEGTEGESGATPPTARPPTVCLQPLGAHDEDLLAIAERGVDVVYGFPTRIVDARPLPPSAWYEKRERWRADTILDVVGEWRTAASASPEVDNVGNGDVEGDIEDESGDGSTDANGTLSGCDIVVGFTKRDISTTKGEVYDWGIFGLGEMSGHIAVVSTYRLGRKKNHADDEPKRTVKVVNHEIGHVLGIPHGGEVGCLMNDAEGSIETVDAETGLLCEPSLTWIEAQLGVEMERLESMPWARILDGGE